MNEIDRLRARVAELEHGARHFLDASSLGVSEAEGLRRAQALADLVGYPHDRAERASVGLPLDPAKRWAELQRILALVEEEIRGNGWAVALFCYRETSPDTGEIAHVSRDRAATFRAVARWILTVGPELAGPAKAQG